MDPTYYTRHENRNYPFAAPHGVLIDMQAQLRSSGYDLVGDFDSVG
jgi:hypothetical protein